MKDDKKAHDIAREIYKKHLEKFVKENLVSIMKDFLNVATEIEVTPIEALGNFFSKLVCVYLDTMKHKSVPNKIALYILIKGALRGMKYDEKDIRPFLQSLCDERLADKIIMGEMV